MRDGFGGEGRIAALCDLEEFAPQVAPAKGDGDSSSAGNFL